ncbi:MAG: SAF domain-containing protein, partial [Solobacterium sp.]|nr:SAF domain-containing protein [Solobacterium sp.]
MNKETIRKYAQIALISSLIFLVWNFGIRVDVNRKLDLTVTYVAAHTLKPRTLITENDILEIRIPSSYLLDRTLTDKKDIIGKYTEIQGMIPAGSPFYRDMVKDRSELPDSPYLQL